ncbi:hypothetical protein [Photobacterium damselae]|uniref:hypothetical protein n=1 Tax=Photobacterium damselae TaxID=38293 RepID=UPI004067827E
MQNIFEDTYDANSIVIIDIEASSLSEDSYPIECAWLSIDGEEDSFLINPLSVNGWDDWDERSESIHSIQRDALIESGISAYDAAVRLNKMLSGCLVISDYAGSDGFWMQRLYESVGVVMEFVVVDIMEIAYISNKMDKHSEFRKMKSLADIKHRALADCRQNLDFYLSLGLLTPKN